MVKEMLDEPKRKHSKNKLIEKRVVSFSFIPPPFKNTPINLYPYF